MWKKNRYLYNLSDFGRFDFLKIWNTAQKFSTFIARCTKVAGTKKLQFGYQSKVFSNLLTAFRIVIAQLERFVFRTVAALGDELADGRIDPDPCIRDAKDSACAFCPYSEVCAGHEQPRWLKKITAEEFWQTLERREHG